jgi:branched-chain amino acid transport system substrate-binding protein
MERAVRGAVHDLQGRFKNSTLRYVALDSSSVDANGWDPGVAAVNARRAALDTTTFAYIGELDSGATAVALPILNQAGVLMISP